VTIIYPEKLEKEIRRIPSNILRLRVKNYAILMITEKDPGYTYLEHMLYPETYTDYREAGLRIRELLEHVVGESLNEGIKKIKVVIETRKGTYLFEATKGKIKLVTSL